MLRGVGLESSSVEGSRNVENDTNIVGHCNNLQMPNSGHFGNDDTDEKDGCLYSDNVIMNDGVSFQVKYIGCLEVNTSMKSLDFHTRTQVARECINRVCKAAGLISSSKRRIDKKILQCISDNPILQDAGMNVTINVSSKALKLVNIETNHVIVKHNMPRISFASGGDSDTLDFLAYIAKNEDDWRACYVLECGGRQSEDLIVTIGKAFMLRYNALNKNAPFPKKFFNAGKGSEKDYYNDLPNKSPPEFVCEDNIQHQVVHSNNKKHHNGFGSNLIDLNSPPPDHLVKNNLSNFEGFEEEHSSSFNQEGIEKKTFSLSGEIQRSQLMTESWFHAGITRSFSESLLRYDGDFLVRESQGKRGQYVLTGLENKTPKHLLLIDPEGIVRTKDRIFDSISHLINYHWTNELPILSEETELILRNPIVKRENI